jgi:hypothetical protein
MIYAIPPVMEDLSPIGRFIKVFATTRTNSERHGLRDGFVARVLSTCRMWEADGKPRSGAPRHDDWRNRWMSRSKPSRRGPRSQHPFIRGDAGSRMGRVALGCLSRFGPPMGCTHTVPSLPPRRALGGLGAAVRVWRLRDPRQTNDHGMQSEKRRTDLVRSPSSTSEKPRNECSCRRRDETVGHCSLRGSFG